MRKKIAILSRNYNVFHSPQKMSMEEKNIASILF